MQSSNNIHNHSYIHFCNKKTLKRGDKRKERKPLRATLNDDTHYYFLYFHLVLLLFFLSSLMHLTLLFPLLPISLTCTSFHLAFLYSLKHWFSFFSSSSPCTSLFQSPFSQGSSLILPSLKHYSSISLFSSVISPLPSLCISNSLSLLSHKTFHQFPLSSFMLSSIRSLP